MLWIILSIFAIIILSYAFLSRNAIVGIISFVFLAVSIICFFAIPVKWYMDVQSTHWIWTVDIYTYQAVKKSNSTGHFSSRWQAEENVKNLIPQNAYNVKIDTHRKSEEIVDREWKDEQGHIHKQTHTEYLYYSTYSYTNNEWVRTSAVSATGNDKQPHEPVRPYDISVPDELGNRKCSPNHVEEYTVTGIVNGKSETFSISKANWEQIGNNDEFSYSKFRFGKTVWGLELAR